MRERMNLPLMAALAMMVFTGCGGAESDRKTSGALGGVGESVGEVRGYGSGAGNRREPF